MVTICGCLLHQTTKPSISSIVSSVWATKADAFNDCASNGSYMSNWGRHQVLCTRLCNEHNAYQNTGHYSTILFAQNKYANRMADETNAVASQKSVQHTTYVKCWPFSRTMEQTMNQMQMNNNLLIVSDLHTKTPDGFERLLQCASWFSKCNRQFICLSSHPYECSMPCSIRCEHSIPIQFPVCAHAVQRMSTFTHVHRRTCKIFAPNVNHSTYSGSYPLCIALMCRVCLRTSCIFLLRSLLLSIWHVVSSERLSVAVHSHTTRAHSNVFHTRAYMSYQLMLCIKPGKHATLTTTATTDSDSIPSKRTSAPFQILFAQCAAARMRSFSYRCVAFARVCEHTRWLNACDIYSMHTWTRSVRLLRCCRHGSSSSSSNGGAAFAFAIRNSERHPRWRSAAARQAFCFVHVHWAYERAGRQAGGRQPCTLQRCSPWHNAACHRARILCSTLICTQTHSHTHSDALASRRGVKRIRNSYRCYFIYTYIPKHMIYVCS